jgi:hypothetical protein
MQWAALCILTLVAAALAANVTVPHGTAVNFSVAAGATFSIQETVAGANALIVNIDATAALDNVTYLGEVSTRCPNTSDLEARLMIRPTVGDAPLVPYALRLDLGFLPYTTKWRELAVCHSPSEGIDPAWVTVSALCNNDGRADGVVTDTTVGQRVCTGTEFASRLQSDEHLMCPSGRYGCKCDSSEQFVVADEFGYLYWFGFALALIAYCGTACLDRTLTVYKVIFAIGILGGLFMVIGYSFGLPVALRRPDGYLCGSDAKHDAFRWLCFLLGVAGLVVIGYVCSPLRLFNPYCSWERAKEGSGAEGAPANDPPQPLAGGENNKYSRRDILRRVTLWMFLAVLAVLPASNSYAASSNYLPVWLLGLPWLFVSIFMLEFRALCCCCRKTCCRCNWTTANQLALDQPAACCCSCGEQSHLIPHILSVVYGFAFLVWFAVVFATKPCNTQYIVGTC